MQIAHAPKASSRMQAVAELEQDQGWVLPARDDDIDLSLLTACLVPSEQVMRLVLGFDGAAGHTCLTAMLPSLLVA